VSDSAWSRRREKEAAWALHELQTQATSMPVPTQVRAGSKRSRTASIDDPLQERVRELLSTNYQKENANWEESFVRGLGDRQIPVPSTTQSANKRLCCSIEAVDSFGMSSLHPTLLHPAMGGIGGPGMWTGILH